jgi:TPR repeat protein
MSDNTKFSEEAQSYLLSAAVILYEAEMYDVSILILHVLMSCQNREAFVLAGHCISESKYSNHIEISNKYYEVACDLGSAVGCYNLYENYKENNSEAAKKYLKKAKKLGWKS